MWGAGWPAGLTVHFPGRLLRSYLKRLEKMEEEPEHMSREQGEGLGRGPVDGRLRAAREGAGLLLPPVLCRVF